MAAVCGEAGLSPAASDSVVRAAQAGTINQNPGVILLRLLRTLDALSPALGRRTTLTVIRSAPSLLNYSPDTLRWNVDMLAALLPEGTVAGVVAKAPMLLPASAVTLWANFDGLRRLLRLSRVAALRLVVRAPRLLLNTRGALVGRIEQLSALAGHPPLVRLLTAIERQPSLLGYFPATLAKNLQHIADTLGVPLERCRALLLKQPNLVMLARSSFTCRYNALRAILLMLDEEGQEGAGAAGAGLAEGALREVAQGTGVEVEAEGSRSEQEGEAEARVSCGSALEQAGGSGLEAGGGTPLHGDEDVAAVVLRQPGLLTLSPDNVQRKVEVVRRVLGLGPEGQGALGLPARSARERREQLVAVLRSAPQLLTLSAHSIEAKAAALKAAVAGCPELEEQLRWAPKVTLALWLCLSGSRYDRVRAAAQAEVASAAAGRGAAGCEAVRGAARPGVVCGGGAGVDGGMGQGAAAGRQASCAFPTEDASAPAGAAAEGGAVAAEPGVGCMGGGPAGADAGCGAGVCDAYSGVQQPRRRGRPRKAVAVMGEVICGGVEVLGRDEGGVNGTGAASPSVGAAVGLSGGLPAGSGRRRGRPRRADVEGGRPGGALSLAALMRG